MSQIVFKNPTVSDGPDQTGTGNGTVSIDRLTHFTIEQDYTLTCIAKTPDTLFAVVGSLDGSVGIATVGTQFFDEDLKIFLTIQQGSTVFEVGDEFTLSVENGTDLEQSNIDDYDELPQKNFGAGTLGTATGDHNLRIATTAQAAVLHYQDLKFLAVTPGAPGNSIDVKYIAPAAAVQAAATFGGVHYTAVPVGAAGNAVTIEITGGGTQGGEIVSVIGSAVTIQVEEGVSLASDVVTAINASAPALAVISVSASSPSTVQVSQVATNLTGGTNAVGSPGLEAAFVAGNHITVSMTDGASTAAQILTALQANAGVLTLVTPSVEGDTSAAQAGNFAHAAIPLTGGKNKTYSFNRDQLTDSGAFVEGNASVQMQDGKLNGNLSVAGYSALSGALSLSDQSIGNTSGSKVANVQKAINSLIKQGKIQVNSTAGSICDYTSGVVSCDDNIEIYFRDSAIKNVVDMTGGISLTDGQSAYVILNPLATETISPIIATTIPSSSAAFRIVTRVGSMIIWYSGNVMKDGQVGQIGGPGGDIDTVSFGPVTRDFDGNIIANKAIVATGAGNGIDVPAAGDLNIGASVGAHNINIGASSSTTIIKGNLEVQGTTTTIDSQTLDVADKNITVNKAGTDGSSEGAGITIDRASTKGSIIYAAAAASRFKAGDLGSEKELVDISSSQTLQNKLIQMLAVDTINDTTSGTGATLNTPTKSFIRLTNASLVSIALIPAVTPSDVLILSNATGVDIAIQNETGGTAANRILTGTGGPMTMKANASLILIYDLTTTRWRVVGGSGGGTFDDLTGLSTTGLIARTGTNAVATRTIQPVANQTAVTNGGGVAGDPTIGLATNPTIPGSGAVTIPAGPTSNRVGTPAQGALRFNNESLQLEIYNGTSWVTVGSSGSSGVNYVKNPDAEVDTSGWNTYADAAGTAPVDGTGGSALSTWTRSVTAPLRNTASFLFTKSAANRQGEGVSYPFTIDDADKAKTLSVTFDYKVDSGTYADGDMSVWVYDVTNAVMIGQLAPFAIANTGIIGKFQATFQTAFNSSSYRLIFHVASTSASAYTLKMDNVSVGPQSVSYGVPATDWASYVPTFTGFGTVTGISFWWRRLGDSVQIKGTATAGTIPAATIGRISMPSGQSADIAKTGSLSTSVGMATVQHSSTDGVNNTANVFINGGTGSNLSFSNFGTGASIHNLSEMNSADLFSTGAQFTIYANNIPVTGWSSNVIMSDSAETRVVAAVIQGTPANVTTNNPVIFPTILNDTHGAYNATTGKYTVAVSGYYTVITSAAATVVAATQVRLYVNGSYYATIGQNDIANDVWYGSGLVKLNVGDTIDVRPDGNMTSFQSTAGLNNLFINRISGPSTIATSEKIRARYNAGVAFTTGTGSSRFAWTVKEFDSHGAVTPGATTSNTTWLFTAPRAGYYRVHISAAKAAASGSNGAFFIRTFGTGATGNHWTGGSATNSEQQSGSSYFYLPAGGSFYVDNGTGSANNFAADSTNNWIVIESD